jgi:GNAT superfamily N-acetyltransferase
VIVRDAAAADVQGCNEVWVSTQPGIGALVLPDQPLSRHELATGRLVVAEAGGEIVGFGGTLTRSGVLYLADLFVTPSQQSRGIGRQLLDILYAGHHGPLFTFASADPRARRLYEQFGMLAIERYYYLDARVDALVPWTTDIDLVAAERADIVALDVAITRRDRAADIDYATSLGARWYLACRAGTFVGAIALVAPTPWNVWHPNGARVGPVFAERADDIAPILSSALAAVVASVAPLPDIVSIFVASSLPALPLLLQAGFEVIDTDVLMTSDDEVIDRHRYLPTVDTP